MDLSDIVAADDSQLSSTGVRRECSVVQVMCLCVCVCVIKNLTYNCLFSIPSGTEVLHTSACLLSNEKCFLPLFGQRNCPAVQLRIQFSQLMLQVSFLLIRPTDAGWYGSAGGV